MSGPVIYSKADIAKHDAAEKRNVVAGAKRSRERYRKKSKEQRLIQKILKNWCRRPR